MAQYCFGNYVLRADLNGYFFSASASQSLLLHRSKARKACGFTRKDDWGGDVRHRLVYEETSAEDLTVLVLVARSDDYC